MRVGKDVKKKLVPILVFSLILVPNVYALSGKFQVSNPSGYFQNKSSIKTFLDVTPISSYLTNTSNLNLYTGTPNLPYKVTKIEGSEKQDLTFDSSVNTQYLNKTINLTLERPYSVNLITEWQTDMNGTCDYCSDSTPISKGETKTFEARSHGDWITESRSELSQGKAVEDGYVPFTFKENWTVQSNASTGFKNLNNTYTIPDSAYLKNVTISGTTYYYFNETSGNAEINSNLVNVSGNQVMVNWNKTINPSEVLSLVISYLDLPISVSEGPLDQDPNNIFPNPYDSDYKQAIPFYREVTIQNPSSNNTYYNTSVNASITQDTVKDTVKLYDPEGDLCPDTSGSYECYNLSINVSEANVEWVIGEIKNTTRYWDLYFNITELNKSITNYTTTLEFRDKWIKELNISTNKTTIENTHYYTSVETPEDLVSIKLFLNGTEVTTDPSYSVNIKDTDGDGNNDYIEWLDPEISGFKRWQVRGDKGFPIKVFQDKVIENPPVKEGKNIQWRFGLKFWNKNDFSTDYSYKARIPLNAFETYVNGNFQQVRFDSLGSYIPLSFTINSHTNETRYIRYKTRPITITVETYTPDAYFVNESAEITKNITLVNFASDEIKDVEKRIPIDYGENVRLYYENGTLKNEVESVTEEYILNVKKIDAKETRKYTIKYDIPTASLVENKQLTSDSGNPMYYYKIRSNAKRPLDPLKLEIEDLDANKVINATNFNTGKQYNLESNKDFKTVVNLGKLAVNEEIEVLVEYREAKKVVNPRLNMMAFYSLGAMGIVSLIVIIIFIIKYYLLPYVNENEGE